jgi:hypothetical protein
MCGAAQSDAVTPDQQWVEKFNCEPRCMVLSFFTSDLQATTCFIAVSEPEQNAYLRSLASHHMSPASTCSPERSEGPHCDHDVPTVLRDLNGRQEGPQARDGIFENGAGREAVSPHAHAHQLHATHVCGAMSICTTMGDHL